MLAGPEQGEYLLFYDADAYANRELLYNFLSTVIKRGSGSRWPTRASIWSLGGAIA